MTSNIQDVYKTIKDPSTEVLFKDRGSKFFAYAYPVKTIEQVQEVLDHIKSLHPSAGHHCFAYQLGEGYEQYRVSDDGEPNHSAGTPIYGQIQSLELTNCLVVVVRYFGGTKLGVSGLVHAYKTSAAQALEHTDIIEQYITRRVVISFQYEEIGVLMRYLKTQDHRITEQHLGTPCTLTLEVRLGAMEELKRRLAQWHRMTCKILDH